MKFVYTQYDIKPTRTNPTGVVYRPEVLLRVIGPKGDAHILALIDSGADETVLPLSMAEEVGASLFYSEAALVVGVAGTPFEYIPGEVEMELISSGPPIRWRTCVAFARFEDSESECAVLGHTGVLQFFTATLHGDVFHGALEPNADLPTP